MIEKKNDTMEKIKSFSFRHHIEKPKHTLRVIIYRK